MESVKKWHRAWTSRLTHPLGRLSRSLRCRQRRWALRGERILVESPDGVSGPPADSSTRGVGFDGFVVRVYNMPRLFLRGHSFAGFQHQCSASSCQQRSCWPRAARLGRPVWGAPSGAPLLWRLVGSELSFDGVGPRNGLPEHGPSMQTSLTDSLPVALLTSPYARFRDSFLKPDPSAACEI